MYFWPMCHQDVTFLCPVPLLAVPYLRIAVVIMDITHWCLLLLIVTLWVIHFGHSADTTCSCVSAEDSGIFMSARLLLRLTANKELEIGI